MAFLPMTVVLMVMNIIAGRLITRFGARLLMVFGLLLAATGYLLLLPVSVSGAYLQLVLAMLMAASGIALIVPTITNITLSSIDPSRAGIASGVLNTARQVGGMLGVATCGYFVRDTTPTAFMHGMHLSLILATVLLVFGAALSLFCLKLERSLVTAGNGQQSREPQQFTARAPIFCAKAFVKSQWGFRLSRMRTAATDAGLDLLDVRVVFGQRPRSMANPGIHRECRAHVAMLSNPLSPSERPRGNYPFCRETFRKDPVRRLVSLCAEDISLGSWAPGVDSFKANYVRLYRDGWNGG